MSRQLQTLLVLGRVSCLPTIWSNCVAGWWLGGGGNFGRLTLLLIGITALYTGGAILNDAFDADFDRQHRPNRPIPGGVMTRKAVWVWSFGFLTAGALALAFISKTTGILALILLVCIIVYNAGHKAFNASPWLMGLCRFWVYVIAGSTGAGGLNGGPIWCGLALLFYVAGLEFLAQRGNVRGRVPWWTLLLLAVPVVLAMFMNSDRARNAAALISLVLVLWVARSLRPVLFDTELNVSRVVAGLVAGIVLVDWLAVAPLPGIPPMLSGTVFIPLFLGVLLLQRYAPSR
ncbi:MAG TPA: UbiA family prenyltransferase [Verrucomicrobiae bacterium]|nr:UbiA family prenyltransferase [Verrucomicrobiae bacterium]